MLNIMDKDYENIVSEYSKYNNITVRISRWRDKYPYADGICMTVDSEYYYCYHPTKRHTIILPEKYKNKYRILIIYNYPKLLNNPTHFKYIYGTPYPDYE